MKLVYDHTQPLVNMDNVLGVDTDYKVSAENTPNEKTIYRILFIGNGGTTTIWKYDDMKKRDGVYSSFRVKATLYTDRG